MSTLQTDSRWTHRAKAVFSSLSLRLFLSLTAVIFAAFIVYTWISVRAASRQYERALYEGAVRFSDLIERSTEYGMLVNRKDEVHHVIQAIAQAPDMEGVRIYDKNGAIVFSADSTEIGRSVDLTAEACVTCHGQGTPLRSVPDRARVRVFRNSGGRVMGVVNAIENRPQCARAGCHVAPEKQSVLGVLDVRMSLAKQDARLASARRRAFLGALAVALAAGLVSALFIFRVVRRPVRRLIQGARRVASGDLNAEIPVEGRSELAELAGAFNDMTRELRLARRELTDWSGQLETRLQERTTELTRAQREVAHMDKTASLGRLAATVAHELNNPLGGILNYAKLTSRTLREGSVDETLRREADGYLTIIQREADRCGVIVRNLLIFARRSGAPMGPHTLRPIVERALMLVRHHLEISSIRLEVAPFDGDDSLVCDADQVHQALVALFVNAVEAMPQGGTLRVGITGTAAELRISIADTGVGIPPEIRDHIFEPFFSTKDRQEGVGLGLAVVHGIVQRHGGRIEVESEVQRGTVFHLILPRRPSGPGVDDAGDGARSAGAPALSGVQ
ncbi:MAG: sensor histidine kinase [Bacteroidota bacterium]